MLGRKSLHPTDNAWEDDGPKGRLKNKPRNTVKSISLSQHDAGQENSWVTVFVSGISWIIAHIILFALQ